MSLSLFLKSTRMKNTLRSGHMSLHIYTTRPEKPISVIDACDELILWFGDGPYVERALELKMLYQHLPSSGGKVQTIQAEKEKPAKIKDEAEDLQA